jgi:hypothetical protein
MRSRIRKQQLVAQHEGGPRVGDDVVDLVGPHLRVHRHDDTTGPAHGQAQEKEPVPVGHCDDDTVAGIDAGTNGGGQTVNVSGGLGVGAPVAAGFLDQPPVPVDRGQPLEDVTEGEVASHDEPGPIEPSQK